MPRKLPGEAAIRAVATPDVFARGRAYCNDGAVTALVGRGPEIVAEVAGSEPEPYRVTLRFAGTRIEAARCTCPYAWGGACKHVVAALLALAADPGMLTRAADAGDAPRTVRARRPGRSSPAPGGDRSRPRGLDRGGPRHDGPPRREADGRRSDAGGGPCPRAAGRALPPGRRLGRLPPPRQRRGAARPGGAGGTVVRAEDGDRPGREVLLRLTEAAHSSHPDWVIALGERRAAQIMDEGSAGRYAEAAEWLKRVAMAYDAAGRIDDWSARIEALIVQYKRKHKLRPLLEALRFEG